MLFCLCFKFRIWFLISKITAGCWVRGHWLYHVASTTIITWNIKGVMGILDSLSTLTIALTAGRRHLWVLQHHSPCSRFSVISTSPDKKWLIYVIAMTHVLINQLNRIMFSWNQMLKKRNKKTRDSIIILESKSKISYKQQARKTCPIALSTNRLRNQVISHKPQMICNEKKLAYASFNDDEQQLQQKQFNYQQYA